MIKKENLEFCFKGKRTYVQGPDIFDAVLEKLKNYFDLDKINTIKYSAYEMLYANAYMSIVKDFNKNDYEKINSLITFKFESTQYYIVVSESKNEIKCSNNYSEDIVNENSIITSDRIEFKNILNDSLTEIIVSMNKYYLQNTVTKDGKWIVTKFEYNSFQDLNGIKNKMIELKLKNNFNNKLTKSIITIDNEAVGYLYFTLI